MDLNTHFLTNYSEHFVESRRQSANTYSFGNGSPIAGMIATVAAGIRRAAATIERWARGGSAEVVDYSLPTMKSVQ
ncbi:MAG: hypothetical protein ABI577_08120 [bacterium]